ncbi:unnamed protein product [Pieris macdunnoughi]|uniref:Endonuclease-reverse transcriptase n=1 Tax=Pieris macdunnoughi TaxID=345717 RepID=A0A821VSK7_9NEOP|nr:unnamed protein product [Pieris macdunnoughi]
MEDQFQMLFEKMRIEMKEQNTRLEESLTDKIINRMDEKLKPILTENENLKLKVGTLEKEIEHLRRSNKENNLIIFDLKEEERSITELLQNFQRQCLADLNITLKNTEVNKIYRIGKPRKQEGKPRPILISFVNSWKKHEILKNKRKFKKLHISEDFSKEVLEKRKLLKPKLIEELKKGKIAYLKNDQLIVKENCSNTDKRKRELSASPQTEQTAQPKKQQALLSSKTNRTNAFDMMRARSSSLSTSSDKRP